jgi:hypothetical protein
VHERVERMLTMVRRIIGNAFKDELGLLLSKEVAATVTKEQVIEWLKEHQRKLKEAKDAEEWASLNKDDIIEIAFNSTRGSLAATLKRAQLLRKASRWRTSSGGVWSTRTKRRRPTARTTTLGSQTRSRTSTRWICSSSWT